jgi:N-acetylneuraminic acid mutarotase
MATVKGIWVFNDTLTFLDISPNDIPSFTSNGDTFPEGIYTWGDSSGFHLYYTIVEADGMAYQVYLSDSGWDKEAYKTIDFGDAEKNIGDTFYTWLTANATQQAEEEPTSPYKFTKLENSKHSVVADCGEMIETLETVLPSKRYDVHAVAIGTKIYLVGGQGSVALQSVHKFDTDTSVISNYLNLDVSGSDFAMAAVGAKIYIFGGMVGSAFTNEIRMIDTDTRTVETLSTTFSGCPLRVVAATVGTKIYLFGGSYQVGGSGASNKIMVFDAETNTLKTCSTVLPYEVKFIGVATVGTKVYLFGGRNSSGNLDTISVFDSENNKLQVLSTKLPVATNQLRTAVIGTKVYLIGGTQDNSTIKVFDTETNTIDTLSVTVPSNNRKAPGVAAIGNKIYLFGGGGGAFYYADISLFTKIQSRYKFTKLMSDSKITITLIANEDKCTYYAEFSIDGGSTWTAMNDYGWTTTEEYEYEVITLKCNQIMFRHTDPWYASFSITDYVSGEEIWDNGIGLNEDETCATSENFTFTKSVELLCTSGSHSGGSNN